MPEESPNGTVKTVQKIVYEDMTALPQPHSIEWEQAKEVYKSAVAVEQASWMVMGYAASCVVKSYGEGSLEAFAYEVDVPYSTVCEKRRIYSRLMGIETTDRLEILEAVRTGQLSYSHLVIAHPLEVGNGDYVTALQEAHDNEWGKRRFAEEVAAMRSLTAAVPTIADEDREEAVYEGAEVVQAQRKICPQCLGEGEVYDLEP